MTTRRFPPPWSAEVQPNYYVVRDADGQQIAYVYYSNDPERRSAAKLLTKDEARRIAANIAKLPELWLHLLAQSVQAARAAPGRCRPTSPPQPRRHIEETAHSKHRVNLVAFFLPMRRAFAFSWPPKP
jgi:hypothetical protein